MKRVSKLLVLSPDGLAVPVHDYQLMFFYSVVAGAYEEMIEAIRTNDDHFGEYVPKLEPQPEPKTKPVFKVVNIE